MYICIYVCICVYIHICIHTYTRACALVRTSKCMHVCMYICKHVRMHVWLTHPTQANEMFMHTYIYTNTDTHILTLPLAQKWFLRSANGTQSSGSSSKAKGDAANFEARIAVPADRGHRASFSSLHNSFLAVFFLSPGLGWSGFPPHSLSLSLSRALSLSLSLIII